MNCQRRKKQRTLPAVAWGPGRVTENGTPTIARIQITSLGVTVPRSPGMLQTVMELSVKGPHWGQKKEEPSPPLRRRDLTIGYAASAGEQCVCVWVRH